MSTSYDTVEQLVRAQLAKALGGRRGIVESAVPTALFTVCWIISHDLRLALIVSVSATLVLLVVRLLQRSTVQFVLNALFGIGLGAVFAARAASSSGATADDVARAYFTPGILYNGGYAAVFIVSILIGWPVIGFMIGSVTGDATSWHDDKPLVKVCSRMTWLLAAPCIVRVAVQVPLWLDHQIALLGVSKLVLGWPLQLAALAVMAWLLGRDRTPLEPDPV
ncbi:DUF3159 domain-containing protein [Aeromicrobium sp.]|uniref:DUF3159 domain-containing protein n=1 Tax=Aeromicrobium sp. TaxID=1871063 RepID=UPI0019997F6D|nr:DUF3159 domain-containing protein [Aeromicrobium sp.]MBC7630862.1 DUF3159 domain-containing protein [Aeromicrobium sp.]